MITGTHWSYIAVQVHVIQRLPHSTVHMCSRVRFPIDGIFKKVATHPIDTNHYSCHVQHIVAGDMCVIMRCDDVILGVVICMHHCWSIMG